MTDRLSLRQDIHIPSETIGARVRSVSKMLHAVFSDPVSPERDPAALEAELQARVADGRFRPSDTMGRTPPPVAVYYDELL
jgi:hypothetical protein